MGDDRQVPRRMSASRTGAVSLDTSGPAVAVTGVVLGDIRIGDTTYTLDDIVSAPAFVSRDPLAAPSDLLAAHHRTVTFTGRRAELEAIIAWRDGPGTPWSVKLIHGPGGAGKTRLALRVAELSAGQGWRIVEARHHSSSPSARIPATTAPPSDRLLLIVDYAERWPTEHLIAMLSDPAVRRHTTVRILLISRQAGAWWHAVRHELHKLTGSVGQTELHPLKPGQERQTVFGAARDAFARLLEVDAADIPLPPNLAGPEFDLVLSVHMAALVAVHARRTGVTVPSHAAGLSMYLLDREQAAWSALHRRGVVGSAPAVLEQAVTTAILTRAMPVGDAITALGTARVAADAAQVVDDHSICYPSPRRGMALEPLYPDRLAEDLLALVLPGHDVEDFHVPPSVQHWAGSLLENLLEPLAPWLREGLTVAIETAHRWPHVASDHLLPLLRRRPELAIMAGSAALIRLVELPAVGFDELAAISRVLPARRHVELDNAAASVYEKLALMIFARTTSPMHRMVALAQWGAQLMYAGHHQRALEVLARAIRLCGRLDEQQPGGEHTVPAASMYALQGLTLLELGRANDALEPMRNAVARYRALVRGDKQHLAGLASALSNLSLGLSRVGNSREALAANQEALRIRQRLYRRRPDEMAADLATSLSNVANQFLAAGRVAEALPVAREALALRRELAREDPQTSMIEVAISLNNLVPMLMDLGHIESAFEHAREAVEIRRQLARTNAVAFEPALASALSNLASLEMRIGKDEEATLTAAQAVEVHRRLAKQDPVAHALQYATVTNQWAKLLLRTGRAAQARDAASETLAAIDHIAQVDDGRVRAVQVGAVTSLSSALWDLGAVDEAERAATQLLDESATWEPDHRVALHFDLLRQELSARDLHAPALCSAEAAVRLYRSADLGAPAKLDFAGALIHLGIKLQKAGRQHDAQDVLREAADLVAGPEPKGRQRLLVVKVATLLGIGAVKTGDYRAAIAHASRAGRLGQTMLLPAGTADPLVALLDGLAQSLTVADDPEAAALGEVFRARADGIRGADRVFADEEYRISVA
jgi:tetratricopeptide (TPR) repeat protein